jgi:hypothetical protein
MDQHPTETTPRRNLLTRAFLMVLMAIAYHLSGTVLLIVAVIQYAFALFGDGPNPHLFAFSRSLGLYFQQIVSFQTLVTEELPFPFNDWPS